MFLSAQLWLRMNVAVKVLTGAAQPTLTQVAVVGASADLAVAVRDG